MCHAAARARTIVSTNSSSAGIGSPESISLRRSPRHC